MKKLLALILSLILILSFAACSNNAKETTANDTKSDGIIESNGEIIESDGETEQTDIPATEENGKTEDNSQSQTPDNPHNNNQTKPDTSTGTKPETKPETTPEQKPEAPSQPEAPKTVGNTLLAAFKAKAASAGSALSLAEELVTNEVIAFSGGAMEVEPGYLTGFDNTEIKGFKEGAVFMPMIGTIPFVGYVFVLEDGTDASAFISTLKASANLRWNICTTADEMVSTSVGNKVFFVMCPTSFDQE